MILCSFLWRIRWTTLENHRTKQMMVYEQITFFIIFLFGSKNQFLDKENRNRNQIEPEPDGTGTGPNRSGPNRTEPLDSCKWTFYVPNTSRRVLGGKPLLRGKSVEEPSPSVIGYRWKLRREGPRARQYEAQSRHEAQHARTRELGRGQQPRSAHVHHGR